jgi:membrane protease YdiL (CAAX protease family)
MIPLPAQRNNRSTGHAGNAALDILFVLATLLTVKSALLQFDQLWTYAGPVSLLAGFAVASLLLRRSHQSWADLGLKRPANIPKMLAWSLAALVVTVAAGGVIESALSSLEIGGGAEIDPRYRHRFADLPGNGGLLLYWLSVSWIVGGFVEEMLFRGMLLSRFESLFSRFPYPTAIAVVLQAILFGQQHYYYQGWSGALATGGIALVSAAIYLGMKRNLWPLIISHALANTIGIIVIYARVQPAV